MLYVINKKWGMDGMMLDREPHALNKKRTAIGIAAVCFFIAIALTGINALLWAIHAGVGSDLSLVKRIPAYFSFAQLGTITLTLSAVSIVLYLVKPANERMSDFLYRIRWYLGAIALAVCVAFELSGSSLATWGHMLGYDVNKGLLWGWPRFERGDEYGTYLPITLSQYLNKTGAFSYFSETVRAATTDVFLAYGAPVRSITALFRPFQWGYLLLSPEKGLAFFWCGRLIALFLVSFDFAMLLTQRDKALSFMGAFLVTFAPSLQWWFAISEIVDMFIHAQAFILFYMRYRNEERRGIRLLLLLGMVITLGAYILALYPAWQIILLYVFGALLLCLQVQAKPHRKLQHTDRISIGAATLLFAGIMGLVLYRSMPTIQTTLYTVYPGSRRLHGGDALNRYLSYPATIFFPLESWNLPSNRCNSSVFFDLFPLGLILSLYVIFKLKKRDPILIGLLVLEVFFGVWCAIGLPPALTRVLMLYIASASRGYQALAVIHVFQLLRAMTLIERPARPLKAATIALVLSGVVIVGCYVQMKAYMTYFMLLCAASILFIAMYLCLRYRARQMRTLCTVFLCTVMFWCGATVNPVQQGIPLYDYPVYKEIRAITKENDGKWLVDGMESGMNLPLLAGAPLINSINIQPLLSRWLTIDPEGVYEQVYNRYAHIAVYITDDETQTPFVLTKNDSFSFYPTTDDLQTLDVRYIWTRRDLSRFSDESVTFKQIYENEEDRIYELID